MEPGNSPYAVITAVSLVVSFYSRLCGTKLTLPSVTATTANAAAIAAAAAAAAGLRLAVKCRRPLMASARGLLCC
jgi:hypothetical protein